jgi:hypothetical protein
VLNLHNKIKPNFLPNRLSSIAYRIFVKGRGYRLGGEPLSCLVGCLGSSLGGWFGSCLGGRLGSRLRGWFGGGLGSGLGGWLGSWLGGWLGGCPLSYLGGWLVGWHLSENLVVCSVFSLVLFYLDSSHKCYYNAKQK